MKEEEGEVYIKEGDSDKDFLPICYIKHVHTLEL